jgi:hypothetical protein
MAKHKAPQTEIPFVDEPFALIGEKLSAFPSVPQVETCDSCGGPVTTEEYCRPCQERRLRLEQADWVDIMEA